MIDFQAYFQVSTHTHTQAHSHTHTPCVLIYCMTHCLHETWRLFKKSNEKREKSEGRQRERRATKKAHNITKNKFTLT